MSLKLRHRLDKTNSQGEAPVFIQYINNGKNYMFSTGVRVAPQHFTGTPKNRNQWITNKLVGSRTLNKKIKNKWDEIDHIIDKLGGAPTVEELKNYNSQSKSSQKKYSKKLCLLFQEYIDTAFKKGRTRAAKLSALNKIKQYNENILISSIDLNYIDKFVVFMRDELELAESTIAKTIKDIKAAIYFFDDRGWIDKETFYSIPVRKFKVQDYKPSHIDEKTFLFKEELEKLINFDISTLKPHLVTAWERNIIQCQTGLRISDIHRISRSNIQGSEIVMFAQKTGKALYIPMTRKVKEILTKHNYSLPYMPDPKYNKYLKDLYKIVGINRGVKWPKFKFDKLPESRKEEIKEWQANQNEHLLFQDKHVLVPMYAVASSHMAVRTFITLAEQLGLSLKDVCDITGKTVKIIENHYWGSNKESRVIGMNKFDEALSS